MARVSTACTKSLWAPWRLPLPTSSWSSRHQAAGLSSGPERKPSSVAQAHSRSSMRGARPDTPPRGRGARPSAGVPGSGPRPADRPGPRPAAGPAGCAGAAPPRGPYRGCRSTAGLKLWPVFTSRCIWMARLGMMSRSSARFTSRVSITSHAAHHRPARQAQRPVQPAVPDHSAVALHGQAGVTPAGWPSSPFTRQDGLSLWARGDLPAVHRAGGNAEGHNGAAAPHHIIFAGGKCQCSVSCRRM